MSAGGWTCGSLEVSFQFHDIYDSVKVFRAALVLAFLNLHELDFGNPTNV